MGISEGSTPPCPPDGSSPPPRPRPGEGTAGADRNCLHSLRGEGQGVGGGARRDTEDTEKKAGDRTVVMRKVNGMFSPSPAKALFISCRSTAPRHRRGRNGSTRSTGSRPRSGQGSPCPAGRDLVDLVDFRFASQTLVGNSPQDLPDLARAAGRRLGYRRTMSFLVVLPAGVWMRSR